MPDPRDEFTLLCESCGYTIDGLPHAGNCPECGAPIAGSLPAHRPGTPWQQRRTAVNWWHTVALLMSRPRGVWARVRIEPVRSGFGRVNIVAASLLMSAVAAARLVREIRLADDAASNALWPWLIRLAPFMGLAAMMLVIGVLGLTILTRIESLGVRFFGGRRGWRVTPAVADTVCGHATVGWLVAAALWAGCALAVDTGIARRVVVELGIPRPRPSMALRAIAPFAGFLVGLLVFEFLVYFGIRRNRYANRVRPDDAQRSAA